MGLGPMGVPVTLTVHSRAIVDELGDLAGVKVKTKRGKT